jgi:hypothetical protein
MITLTKLFSLFQWQTHTLPVKVHLSTVKVDDVTVQPSDEGDCACATGDLSGLQARNTRDDSNTDKEE